MTKKQFDKNYELAVVETNGEIRICWVKKDDKKKVKK